MPLCSLTFNHFSFLEDFRSRDFRLVLPSGTGKPLEECQCLTAAVIISLQQPNFLAISWSNQPFTQKEIFSWHS
jgi:hypothetical protein